MPFPDGIVNALEPARLRLLVEVQRQGSISAAAEACAMGQPSATKHLKTLEAAVGEKLVERHGRASRLTPAGEVVAVHAARALDALDAMHAELSALRGAELGTLRLAASTARRSSSGSRARARGPCPSATSRRRDVTPPSAGSSTRTRRSSGPSERGS